MTKRTVSDPILRGVNRRDFLQLALALGGTAWACSSSSGAPARHDADAGTDGGVPPVPEAGVDAAAVEAGASDSVPFAIWQSLRDAVRGSPDHLLQVANALATKGDPAAIFEFVRDQIVTCPPASHATEVTGIRWGARAALRSGMGTPREKAELLVLLYEQAGLTASVVTGSISTPNDETASIYGQNVQRSFAPTVDQSTLDEWNTQMSVAGPTLVPTIDPDDTERQSIVQAISALLPATVRATLDGTPPTVESLLIDGIPLVAVQVNGATSYANPLLPTAVFGKPYTTDAPVAAPAPTPALPVTVELFVSSTANPAVRTSVAKTTFSADQVVGRQVAVQFLPRVDDPDDLLALRIQDLHAFRPVIALRGADVDDATFSKNLVVGADVTLRGDIVATAADGTVTFNGKSVVGKGAATNPSNQSKVATLKVVSVNASGFPSVSVQVSAVDANGKTVMGLPASAFAVAEGGVPMNFVETSSPMQPPSVALIIDVDYPLKNGDAVVDLARQLAAQVAAAGGDITYIFSGIASGPYTDPEALVSMVADNDDDDDCWPDIAACAGTGAVLTVFVSDFEGFAGVDGTPYQTTVYAGPPIIAVGAPDAGGTVTVPPEVTAMVAATGGQSLPGAGIAETLAAVKAFFDARTKAGTYTLTYTAPIKGPATRTVTVKTANGKQSATGTYKVPAATAGAIPAALCGVHLAVTVDTRTVTRTLAGYRGGAAPASDEPLTQADLDEVNGAMFGATILSFEGSAPTLSAWLDDLLTTKLAVKPLWDAAKSGDVAAIRAARGATRNYLPPELAVLQCPLTTGGTGADAGAGASESLTYQSGLRVVACTEHVQIDKGRIRKVDVLNFPGWLTFGTDSKASFAATVARSARAAVIENHVLGRTAQSAAQILAGQKLQFFDAVGVFGAELTTIPANEQRAAAEILNQYKDFYKLIPAQGSLTAFWAISADTGTVMAVLSDGSGGAAAPAACGDLGNASSALDALGLLGDLGPYGALGKAVASVFVATGIILEGASDPNFTYDADALQKGIASSLACNAASDAVTGALGAASSSFDAANKANTVSGIVGGGSLGCGGGLDALGCAG